MQPEIKTTPSKKLIGMHIEMSLVDNKTFQLFSSFMPLKKTIPNTIGNNVFDLQVYPIDYYQNFSPTTYFTKWVLVEVSSFDAVPEGMERFVLGAGDYAVFKGKTTGDPSRIFTYIYTEWLPKSDFVLDDRPHFDILDEKHQRRDPDAEQEVWIPIKSKK